MNKRQTKKYKKKVALWCGLDFVKPKCHCCEFFESGDDSVGLLDMCIVDYQYDEDDNIIEAKAEVLDDYMQLGGYTCPYFKKCHSKKLRPTQKVPKSYRELKEKIRTEKKMLENIVRMENLREIEMRLDSYLN